MASSEDRAYEIMRELDVNYVLVIFGGLTGYASDGKGADNDLSLQQNPLSFHPLSAMRILKFISFLFGISLALLGYVVHSSNNWILISDCGMFFCVLDINKFLWMVRIGGSTEKGRHIKEHDYYTPAGEFRIDRGGSQVLLNCLMYKMCYYRFGSVYTEQGKYLTTHPSLSNAKLDCIMYVSLVESTEL